MSRIENWCGEEMLILHTEPVAGLDGACFDVDGVEVGGAVGEIIKAEWYNDEGYLCEKKVRICIVELVDEEELARGCARYTYIVTDPYDNSGKIYFTEAVDGKDIIFDGDYITAEPDYTHEPEFPDSMDYYYYCD